MSLASKKAYGFFGIGILIFVFVSVFAGLRFKMYSDTLQWVSHTYDVIQALDKICIDLLNAETGQRGYIITGKEEFLGPYYSVVGSLNENLSTVQNLTIDNSLEQGRVLRLRPLIFRRLDLLEANIQRYRTQNPDFSLSFLEGQKVMLEIRKLVFDLADEERSLLEKRSSRATHQFIFLICLVGIGDFSALFCFGYYAILVRKLARLRDEAQAVIVKQSGILSTFIDNAPVAIVMFDKQMHFLAVSHYWTTIFGKTAPEVIGRSCYDVFPSLPSAWKEDHKRVIEKDVRIEVRDDTYNHLDGRVEYINRVLVPWKSEGKIAGLIVYIQIVTNEINARRELERIQSMVNELEIEKNTLLSEIENHRGKD